MAAGQPLNQIYNNPIMIRDSDIPFDGSSVTSGGNLRFSTPEQGISAALKTVNELHASGQNTIASLIESIDIPSGARTDDIALVSKSLGIGSNDVIPNENLESFAEDFVLAYAKVRGPKGADAYWNKALPAGKDLNQTEVEAEERMLDIIEDNSEARDYLESLKNQTTESDTDTHQMLRKATSLDDIVQNWTFLENRLDGFSNYTYTLEFFCVDAIEERKFHISEGFNVAEISSDAWPSSGINKVTIAKTGSSTEFNIDGLTVQSIGVGNTTNSRMAGTATSLEFEITQVGETSLTDNLQNALVLMGYQSIGTATWFMKINFIGYDAYGQPDKIQATKVLPFKIDKLRDVPTVTDERGTVTTLSGRIFSDEVLYDHDVSTCSYPFTFKIEDTLQNTLDTFFTELNNNYRKSRPGLGENLCNEYKWSMSEDFRNAFATGLMQGGSEYTNRNMTIDFSSGGGNGAEQIGTISPGMAIYNILQDITIKSNLVKDELLKEQAEFTKCFKITPHLVPKENGWNAVSGSYAYEVEYFFSYDYREVVQNKLDQINKYTKNKEQVLDYFRNNHVNKIYNYQYTGKNDQILDFNISMNNKLTKIYVQPADAFMYESFVKQGSGSRIAIDDSNRQIINDIEAEYNEAVAIQTGIQGEVDSVSDDIMALSDDMVQEWAQSQGMSMKEAGDWLAGMNGDERLAMIVEDTDLNIFTEARKERLNALHDTLDELKAKGDAATAEEKRLLEVTDQVYQDVIATQLSGRTPVDAANRNLVTAGIINSGTETTPLLLVENIDNDVLSKLETSVFNSILATQLNNPVVFNRITKTFGDPRKLSVLKTTDIEAADLAREKYYESRIGMSTSMINANMTIKGDPYWLEGYIGKPAQIKEYFGEMGSDLELQVLTTLNGINGCIVRSDVTEGFDNLGNAILTQFISSLYTVNNITHSFSGGLFTQNLELSKFTAAEEFDDMNYSFGGELEEVIPQTTLNYATGFGHYPDRKYNDNFAGAIEGGATIQEQELFEATTAPEGAGNRGDVTITTTSTTVRTVNGQIVENSSSTETKTLPIIDSDESYTSSAIAFKNSSSFMVNDPTPAQAKQYAYNLARMQSLCKADAQSMACSDIASTQQQIRNHYGETVAEAETNLNDAIAGGYSVSPEFAAGLNDAYGTTLNLNGVDQTKVDTFDEAIDTETDAFVLGIDETLEDVGLASTEAKSTVVPVEYPDWGGVPARLLNDGYVPLMSSNDVPVIIEPDPSTSLDVIDTKEIIIPEGIYPPSVLSKGRTLYLPEVETGTYTTKELAARTKIENEINDIMAGSETLDDLTDIQYTRVKQLEAGVIQLDDAVNSGFRGDLNKSVQTREYEQRMMDLKVEESKLKEDLDGWYFTPWGRGDDEERLIEVQSEMSAIQHGMESSKVSTVASIDKGDGAKPVIITEAANIAPLNENGEVAVDELSVLVQHDPSDNDAQTTWNGHVSGMNDEVIDTHNIILPSQLADANLPASASEIEQYQQAHKIYEGLLTHTDNVPFIQVQDDDGYEYQIRDFNNVPPITYIDANGISQTIADPSAYFGFNTSDGEDSYPLTVADYDNVKAQISTLFPAIEVGVPPQTEEEKAKAKTSEGLVISIKNDRFYIKR